ASSSGSRSRRTSDEPLTRCGVPAVRHCCGGGQGKRHARLRATMVSDVDSYIAGVAEKAQPILEELRAIVRSTVPDVEEGISWGVPFYKHHGALGGSAVYTNHVSFGGAGELPGAE